MAVNEEY